MILYANFNLKDLSFHSFSIHHFYYVSVHLTCPDTYDAVGDGCYYESNSRVQISSDCVEECGEDRPAEIHSTGQLDALKDYVESGSTARLYMGKLTVKDLSSKLFIQAFI